MVEATITEVRDSLEYVCSSYYGRFSFVFIVIISVTCNLSKATEHLLLRNVYLETRKSEHCSLWYCK